MKHLKIFIPIIFFFVMGFFSCKKLVEVDPPRNQLVSATVFADSADATAAVVGIYVNIMKSSTGLNFGNGAVTVYAGFSSDEIYPGTNNALENEFYQNSIVANNSINTALWRSAYSLIYHTNACIEGLTSSNSLGGSLKNQLLGEAKFMRALFYFYLVNLYGDVPLVTAIEFKETTSLLRMPSAKIYEQMIVDLTEAQELLSVNYIMPNRVRPNKATAIALLSRIYLYQKDWLKAEQAATQIINSGIYNLEPNLTSVFLPTGKEAIWQMIPLQPGFETAEGFKFIPGNATTKPPVILSTNLLSAFSSADKRRQQWLKFNTVGTESFFYPNKYKLGNDGNTTPKEHYVMLRLAEQYLIRAEANAQQNKLSEAAADLNMIRARAGLSNTTANDQAALLAAIQNERKLELFCEWGHRWFDLKRWELSNVLLAPVKPEWQSTDALYPIPLIEIQSNSVLTQNPGY